MAKPPHTRAAMRAFYPVCQVAELAASYGYTTRAPHGPLFADGALTLGYADLLARTGAGTRPDEDAVVSCAVTPGNWPECPESVPHRARDCIHAARWPRHHRRAEETASGCRS